MLNYILPLKSGVFARAVYLKKRHALEYSHSAAILVFNTFISMQILFFLSAIFMLTHYFLNQKTLFSLQFEVALFLIFVFVMGILFVVILPKLKPEKIVAWVPIVRLRNILNLFMEGTLILSKKRSLFWQILILQICIFFVDIAKLYFAYQALGIVADIFMLSGVNLLSSLTSLINITPGNLGVQEIVIAVSSLNFGVSAEHGLVAASIIRAGALCVVFVAAGIFTFLLRKDLKPQK